MREAKFQAENLIYQDGKSGVKNEAYFGSLVFLHSMHLRFILGGRKMVIIGIKCGQLGNRLFHYSHFIANSLAHGYRIINPAFDEYVKHFDLKFARKDIKDSQIITIKSRKICWLLLNMVKVRRKFKGNKCFKLISIDVDDYAGINNPRFVSIFKESNVIIDGWRFRDPDNMIKFSSDIRSFFKPREIVNSKIQQNISMLREKCDVLIGIHIRRGDYKKWKEGKYFFPDDVYLKYMNEVSNWMGRHKKVLFMLCSDENIHFTAFGGNGLNVVPGPNDMIEDMYSFAMCDYILGPPSTYTLWASFYGKVPFYLIKEKQCNFNPQYFFISKGCPSEVWSNSEYTYNIVGI